MKKIVTCFVMMLVVAMTSSAVAASVKDVSSADVLKMVTADKGKVVLINFFASWCPPCLEEIPSLVKIREDIPASEVTILGVSVDENPKALEAFLDKMDINYPVVRGTGDVIRFFGINSIPRLFIYDRNGALAVDNVGLVPHDDLVTVIEALVGEKK